MSTATEPTNEERARRDSARRYPPGLPYFTRSVEPPALVLPEALSPVFRPKRLICVCET